MLSTLVSTITYNGNDSTTAFDYPFKIWAASEIELWITDAAGAETEVTTNFTLAGVGDETGGTVTYPTSGDPLPTGHKLTLRRVLEISQGFFDAVNNQAFHAETLESAIDKTVAQIQQVKADVDLGLRGSLASGIDPELPLPQAGKVLAWNAAEDAIVNLAASGVVAEGAIGTTELGDDAVTGPKIAAAVAGDGLGRDVSDNFEVNVDDSTIEIATDILRVKDLGITTAKIVADAVDKTKIAADVAGAGLTQAAGGELDVNAASDTAAGRIEIATQAEIEAAASLILAVTPGRAHYHPGTAKAWAQVTVSGGVPAITTSYNVADIVDNGVGDYTINFTNALASADYAALVTTEAATGTDLLAGYVGTKAAGSIQVVIDAMNTGNNRFRVDRSFYCAVFGDM